MTTGQFTVAVVPRLRPPLTKQRVVTRAVLVGILVGVVWAWRQLGMSLGGFVDGAGDVWRLLGRMTPPRFSDVDNLIDQALVTLWMAVVGTFFAVALSIPLAFGAARNTTPHPAVMAVCRAIIVLTRAIPDLVMAAIFVRALRIGLLPGVLALAVHSVGMVGKLFADTIEQTTPQPGEAVDSVGAGKWQSIVTTVLPQAIPGFISTALYRLDINVRSASVLGIVGAGGIGFILQQRLRSLQYPQALGVIIVIFVLIVAVEFLSVGARVTLLGRDRITAGAGAPRASIAARLSSRGAAQRRAAPAAAPRAGGKLRPPLCGERLAKLIYGTVFSALLVYAFVRTRVNPWTFVRAVPDYWRLAQRFFPLDFTTARDAIIEGMVDTLAIAMIASFLGAFLAIPLGMLAARNVAANRIVYLIARVVLVAWRGIPELIVAIVFIAAIGLGGVTGAFAMTVGSAAFFAKLIADSVEEIDPVPREGVFATGATRVQEATTSVIPQAMPALVGNFLYVLDINIRSSAVLGIVGGGGIGFLLFNALRTLNLQTVGAIVVALFVIVYAIELLAGWVRKQIL